MKKQLLAAFAATFAFAACTNEDLIQQIEVPGVEGEMITLDENFALGVTRGGDASATRAQYAQDWWWSGAYITWLPQLDASGNPIFNKVGLSWKGQNADGKVYTNYLFDNFAVPVANPQNKPGLKAVLDPCDGWTNLVFYNKADYDKMTTSATSDYVKEADGWSKSADGLNTVVTTENSKTVDATQAYFKTENLTIFGGDYVMYMPYDESFINAGYLYAKSPSVFEDMWAVDRTEDNPTRNLKMLQHVADYHFYAGHASLKGGETANGFTLSAVTSNVIISLNNKTKNNGNCSWNSINKVAIYGKNGIVVEQAINATDLSLVAHSDATPVKTSTSLMATLHENLTIAVDKSYGLVMTALPQTIEDAQVVLFATDGSSCIKSVGDIVIPRGGQAIVNVDLTKYDKLQSERYYVVDMPTFKTAMENAAETAQSLGVNNTAYITLISDIVYDQEKTNGQIWVNRDMVIEGGSITVPAGHKLPLQLMSEQVNVTVKSPITVQGACCGKDGAIVTVDGFSISRPVLSLDMWKLSTITFEGDVVVEEGASLTLGSAQADDLSYDPAFANDYVNAEFKGAVTNSGTMNIVDDATIKFGALTNNGTLNLSNAGTTNIIQATVATLTNDGAVNVAAKTTLVADNTVNAGTLAIEASGDGTATLDGTVNVQVAMTNNGVIDNSGVYNSNGSTTLNAGSQFVDYVGSQYGNKMPVMNGGDYICEVNTSTTAEGDRLAYALNDKMKTTIVRFVSTAEHKYQLNDYDEYAKLATVDFIIDVDESVDFVFRNNKNDVDGAQIVLGGDLTVESAASVKFNGNFTKIGGDFTVNCAAKICNAGVNSARVEVAGDLTLTDAILTVEALGTNAANQLTTKSWIVGGNVVLNESAKMTVEQNAALDVTGGLTINKKNDSEYAVATFEYSSYSEFGGALVNYGEFNRVLSSGSSEANPAVVWCSAYTNYGTEVNGAAQVSE